MVVYLKVLSSSSFVDSSCATELSLPVVFLATMEVSKLWSLSYKLSVLERFPSEDRTATIVDVLLILPALSVWLLELLIPLDIVFEDRTPTTSVTVLDTPSF